MPHVSLARTAAALAVCIAGESLAQTRTIASLPFNFFISAGPRAQNYPPSQDNLDIWAVEDFSTDRTWRVGEFRCQAAGHVSTRDVFGVILDRYPPNANTVMSSVPGVGRFQQGAVINDGFFVTNFGGQELPPGDYVIMWMPDLPSTTAPAVMFVASGPYAVGMGIPNNSYQYNPGLGWNLPQGALDPVTDQLNNQGNPIGINFSISGIPVCTPDINQDGSVDLSDIFCLAEVVAGGTACSDVTPDFNDDGSVDLSDVFDLANVVAGGTCP